MHRIPPLRADAFQVLAQIIQCLREPSADCPLVPEISRIFREQPALFNETARAWTEKYAC